MTDIGKVTALLTELGIPFTESQRGAWDYTEAERGHGQVRTVTIQSGSGSVRTSGYPGFYTSFVFDTEGRFLVVGAWE